MTVHAALLALFWHRGCTCSHEPLIHSTIVEIRASSFSEPALPRPMKQSNCNQYHSRCIEYIWGICWSTWLTWIHGFDRPHGADVTHGHRGGRGGQRPICSNRWLPVHSQGRVQWGLGIVRERSKAIGGKAVPQGVGQLEPAKPIGHSVPPRLEGRKWVCWFSFQEQGEQTDLSGHLEQAQQPWFITAKYLYLKLYLIWLH